MDNNIKKFDFANIEKICEYAFSRVHLKKVIFGEKLQSIGNKIFFNTSSILYFPSVKILLKPPTFYYIQNVAYQGNLQEKNDLYFSVNYFPGDFLLNYFLSNSSF